VKFTEDKGTIPLAIYRESMPHKERAVLVYLFLISDYDGYCAPGMDGLIKGVSQFQGCTGNRNQMAATLKSLEKLEWIKSLKRSRQGNMTIQVQIPLRHRKIERLPQSETSSKIVKFGS